MTSGDLKTLGNQAFTAGQFEEAINLFTQAIESDPTNHVLFSNRYFDSFIFFPFNIPFLSLLHPWFSHPMPFPLSFNHWDKNLTPSLKDPWVPILFLFLFLILSLSRILLSHIPFLVSTPFFPFMIGVSIRFDRPSKSNQFYFFLDPRPWLVRKITTWPWRMLIQLLESNLTGQRY